MELGAAATLLAMLLTGCVQPTDPTPSASPSPTFMCTPEAGGDQAPCSEADYQKMKEKDALYAEAEQVYRKYLDEYHKVAVQGGAAKLPDSMRDLIGDDELASNIANDLRDLKDAGLHVKGPGVEIKSVDRLPDRTMSGSQVALRFCTDASRNLVYKGDRQVNTGAISIDTLYFRLIEDSLRIVAFQYEDTKTCGA